jgi:hypothetical protein
MGYSGARRKLFHKNLKLKISCQTPFNFFSTLVAEIYFMLYDIWKEGINHTELLT